MTWPLVSVITPTYDRESYLGEVLRIVGSQTYANFEWLVLDDSPEASRVLAGCQDPRLRYMHVPGRLPIGEKRNRLVAEARGELIAHFDDDDYYAPEYLERMVAAIKTHGADFVNLCSWYLYDRRHDFFGFWALRQILGVHYHCAQDAVRPVVFTPQNNAAFSENHLGYGFTYVYRRRVWEQGSFPPIDWNEDGGFVQAARRKFKLVSIADQSRLVLHVLHASSSSSCFPQIHLPTFLLPTLFGATSRFLGIAAA